MPEAAAGLLILDKPSGVTSYDCVHRVKRILDREKAGHCGTLDPLAQGVLLVLVGAATRRQESYLALEKEYWFRARFGVTSRTGDREGEILEAPGFSHVSEGMLRQTIRGFIGPQFQTPPRYAALKYKGKPYYYWARREVEIPRAPRPVHIANFELLSFAGAWWEGRVICSRGTYIRTLVEDVAKKLNTGALLDALVRERVGAFERKDALSWENLSACRRESLLLRLHA